MKKKEMFEQLAGVTKLIKLKTSINSWNQKFELSSSGNEILELLDTLLAHAMVRSNFYLTIFNFLF